MTFRRCASAASWSCASISMRARTKYAKGSRGAASIASSSTRTAPFASPVPTSDNAWSTADDFAGAGAARTGSTSSTDGAGVATLGGDVDGTEGDGDESEGDGSDENAGARGARDVASQRTGSRA